jgi:hypothetical protein
MTYLGALRHHQILLSTSHDDKMPRYTKPRTRQDRLTHMVKIEYKDLFLQEEPRWVTTKGEELNLKWIRVDWSKPEGTRVHRRPALSDKSDSQQRPRFDLFPNAPRTPLSPVEIVRILSIDENGVEHLDKEMPEVPLSLRGMEDELTLA